MSGELDVNHTNPVRKSPVPIRRYQIHWYGYGVVITIVTLNESRDAVPRNRFLACQRRYILFPTVAYYSYRSVMSQMNFELNRPSLLFVQADLVGPRAAHNTTIVGV